MKSALKRLKKALPYALTAVFCLFVAVNQAQAQGVLGNWSQFLEKTLPGLTAETGATGQDYAIAFVQGGISILRYVIGAVALLFGTLYAMGLIFARGNEETIGKQKENFLWAFVGFVILLGAQGVADVFTAGTATSEALIDIETSTTQLLLIQSYLTWFFGSIVAVFMVMSGVRMVMAQGNEEVVDKEKKNFTGTVVGVLVILLARSLVNAVYVVRAGVASPGDTAATATQVAGVIRLILTFMGPMALLYTIYSGYLYLTSFGDEERTSTAKNMILGGITGIVVIYAAYALVNSVVSSNLFS